MKLFLRIISFYQPKAPTTLVYMLQQVEYNPIKFADWVDGIPNLLLVQNRQQLERTARARLMLLVAYATMLLPLVLGIGSVLSNGIWLVLLVGLAGPLVCVVSLFFVTLALQHLVVSPSQNREVAGASNKLSVAPAVRIAILGSYGKTTMKELLATILAEGKKVKATPGNKNVLISHARWVNKSLNGKEDILIFEYGEASPGDISRLSGFSQPTWAVITGLAPAHLDDYGSLDGVASDFADINKFVSPKQLYLNNESPELTTRLQNGQHYSQKGVNKWKTSGIKVNLEGTSFTLTKDAERLKLQTGLLGAHQVGPLCVAVDIASSLGLSPKQIKAGVAKTKPFEHRMQPYQLGGAWIIDDTYNGNIEGVKAGLALLGELEASGRKIYITPGLVEQGELTQQVHVKMGRLIAGLGIDRVVLMKNSVTEYIQAGLDAGGFGGELLIESNPLEFYTNIEHFVAGGDLILMQNDWPDSYK